MSNQQYEALYKGKRHYDKNGKPLGGIKVMVDDSYMVEVEGGEYKICNDAYNSDEVLSFNGKTNKEILDYIHGSFSCKFEQSKAKSGDFILCRLVVNDEKKKKYSGTVRQILDAMQSEHSCRVSFGDKSMKKGGEISPEEIEERWNKKKEHIEKLSEAIRSLRNNLTRDIKGDDEKERLTALAISVIDKTAERVGNGDSEQNGHFGVTGFQKKHIKVFGNTVYLNYIGKSGVKHEKQFSDELISAALKNAMNESSCNFVFCTKDGFRIKPDKINRYLSDYGITAKDIRGYSANRWIVDRLNNIEEKDIPETEAKRKRKFNKILKSVAAKVGHGSGTLKKHYMIPELETTFIQGGEILDLSSFYSKGGYVRLSKTPAPKSERIYGSSKNAPKSAASKDSGKNIELSNSIVSSILNKLKEHNSIHKDKRVTLGVAKAVVRRGMGAYSATHRPTIKGGQPNSRVAWGLARLNAFLIKAAIGKSKSGRYSQDNDLLDELNIPHEKYENGGNFKRQVVGNIIYSKNQGFLFLQRADDCEKNSGKWHILSGGVEDGESLEVAAKREFVEEVGYNGEIEIEKLQTIDFKDYEFTYFLIMPKKPFNPKLDFENKDYKWVYSIDEMLNTDLIPELKEYLISFNKGFNKIYKEGGSIDENCIDFIKKTEAILKNGYYHRFGSFCFITYNSGNQKDLNVYQTVNLILSKSLSEILKIDEESARNLISEYCDNARRFDTLDIIKELKECNIVIADRDKIVCANNMQNDKGGEIENLISQGVIDLKFYETTPEHAKGYGIKAIKPIFVQNLCVSEKHRLKGIGNKVLKYIESYAQNNGNDVIFGYVADNAVFSKDSRQSYLCDADMVKNWLQSKGYAINDDNNDFHKAIKDGTNTRFDPNNDDIRYSDGSRLFNDKKLLAKWEKGESIGFTAIAHLKSKGLIPRADGKKRKSEKYMKDGGGIILQKEKEYSPNCYNKTYIYKSAELSIDYCIGKYFKIDFIDVDGADRRKGYATILVNKAKELAKENGFNEIILSLPVDGASFSEIYTKEDYDTAVSFYKKNGFVFRRESSVYMFLDLKKFEKGGLIAPNGKPSNLTPEQYELVRKPEFISWFGDWENSPETASKVVDSNGEPLPVYHGTNAEPFVVFDGGSFFTDDYMNADGYASGEMVYEVFLNIKKPLIINASGRKWDNLKNKYGNSTRDIVGQLDMDIYDGVIFNNINDNWFDDEMGDTQNVYFSINPEQIKLADGTNTTFDSKNPDIRYEQGGEIQLKIDERDKKLRNDKDYYPYEILNNKGEKLGKIDLMYRSDLGGYQISNSNVIEKGQGIGKKAYLELRKILGKPIFSDSARSEDAEHLWKSLERNNYANYDLEKGKYKIYADGGLIAPNGKPSNLTPEQYKLVRTKAFKDWFGDWENDPANASKVVDENGEPLVVYHGSKSNENFNVFKQSSRFEFIYFAKTKNYSWLHFTKDLIDKPFQLKPFFLNIRNLLNAEEFGFDKIQFNELKSFFYGIYDLEKDIQLNPKSDYKFWEVIRFSNDIFNSLKEEEYYNGISFYENFYENTTWNDTDDYSLTYVVMNPNQIKLADGSNTTFDGSNPDIRFDNGGLIDFSEKEIRKYAENILKDFDYVYSGYSDTNGHSMYFKIDDVKIRFSDHSVTNIYRINNEVLFDLWDGKKIGTPYGDFAINQSILELKYALGDKSIIYHKRPMMMPSGKMVNAFGYSDNSDIHFDNGGSVLLAPNGKPSNLTPEQYKLVRTPEFKAWFGDWENDPKNASKVVDSNGEPKVMWHGSNAMSEINIFKSNKGHDYSFFSDDKNESSRYVIDFDQTEVAKKIDKRNHTERTIKRDLYYKSKIKPFFIKSIKPFDYNNLSETDKSYTYEFLNKNKDELYAVIKEFASNTGMSINVYLEQNDIDVNITESELLKYFLSTSSDDWWILETKAFQEYIKNNNFDSFVTKESGAWNVAVYNPNQIKLADGSNTTFDVKNPDIRYEDGGKTLGKYAFADKYSSINKVARELQGTKEYEDDNIIESSILRQLRNWTFSSDNSNEIYLRKNLYKKLKKEYPKIFKPNFNGLVYRGLSTFLSSIKFPKNVELKDFVKIKRTSFYENDYYLYKLPIEFKERKNVASWTTSFKVASTKFGGDVVLVTKIDDEFIMNPKLMNEIYGSSDKEDEVLHLGKEYTKNVYVMIRDIDEIAENISKKDLGELSKLKFKDGGEVDEHKETYKKWKKLVNMTAIELENFYNSEEGKEAGLKPKEAKDLGIHYGRESARWIIKMKKTPITEWTPEMWEWAKRQINFNTRMLGNKGDLYDEKGKKTRKHTSLLIWGHNPEKKEEGGIIYSIEEMIMSLNKSPFLKVSQMPDGKISFSESNGLNSFKSKKIDSDKLQELFLVYNF